MNVDEDGNPVPFGRLTLTTLSKEAASSILASMPFDWEERRKRYGHDPVYGRFLR